MGLVNADSDMQFLLTTRFTLCTAAHWKAEEVCSAVKSQTNIILYCFGMVVWANFGLYTEHAGAWLRG